MNSPTQRGLSPGLLTALFALILALVALVRHGSADAAPAQPAPDVGTYLEQLEQRLGRLESDSRELSADVVNRPHSRLPADQADLRALIERVTAIERALTERERASPREKAEPNTGADSVSRPESVATDRSGSEDPAARIAEAQRAILDARSDEAAKLQAWRRLRHLGPAAWSEEVIDEMVRVGLGAHDADLRADVWRQAHATARSPRIVPGLLRALSSDPEEGVREEAAETLADYRSDATVRLALEHTASHDSSQKVRRQAQQALLERERDR